MIHPKAREFSDLLSQNAWLSDSVSLFNLFQLPEFNFNIFFKKIITGYLIESKLSKTLLLQYWDTHKLLNNKPCQEIDKINVNEYDNTVGPYLINGNYWTAFIIDIPKENRYFLIFAYAL
jgi:hypothetical protein